MSQPRTLPSALFRIGCTHYLAPPSNTPARDHSSLMHRSLAVLSGGEMGQWAMPLPVTTLLKLCRDRQWWAGRTNVSLAPASGTFAPAVAQRHVGQPDGRAQQVTLCVGKTWGRPCLPTVATLYVLQGPRHVCLSASRLPGDLAPVWIAGVCRLRSLAPTDIHRGIEINSIVDIATGHTADRTWDTPIAGGGVFLIYANTSCHRSVTI